MSIIYLNLNSSEPQWEGAGDLLFFLFQISIGFYLIHLWPWNHLFRNLVINDSRECDAEVRRPRLDLQTSGREGQPTRRRLSPIVADHVIGKGRENLLSWFPFFTGSIGHQRTIPLFYNNCFGKVDGIEGFHQTYFHSYYCSLIWLISQDNFYHKVTFIKM